MRYNSIIPTLDTIRVPEHTHTHTYTSVIYVYDGFSISIVLDSFLSSRPAAACVHE